MAAALSKWMGGALSKPLVLPNFVIAGAPKSGTSSLHSWIADHPDALGSLEKETYFLSDPGTHMYRPDNHVSLGLTGYAAHFPDPGGAKIILESTPGYLYSATALRTLANLPSNPRVLFVLREPGAQILSLFQYFQNNWTWIPAEMGFAEFIAAVRSGSHDFKGNELARHCLDYAAYVDHLLPWRAALGPDRMRVMLFDDLKADGLGFTKKVATWLSLNPDFYDSYDISRENETYTPRSRLLQSVNVAIRDRLPKGPAYEALRRIYRRLNTTKVTPNPNAQTLADIRNQLAPANARLAAEFKLDLRAWNTTG